jgi:ribosomal protein S27AE
VTRRGKYNLESIRSASNIECPHCNAILSPAEYLRLDGERLRCGKCDKDFIPERKAGWSSLLIRDKSCMR